MAVKLFSLTNQHITLLKGQHNSGQLVLAKLLFVQLRYSNGETSFNFEEFCFK